MRYATTVLLALAPLLVLAQQQTVSAITVRGLTAINQDTVLATMTLKVGDVYRQDIADADEAAILSLGYFQDVQIISRAVSDTQVELLIEIAENPIIKEIYIKGNTVIGSDVLTAEVTKIQELGQIYNARYRGRIEAAIEQLYFNAGYRVGFEQFQPDPNSPGTLLIAILEPKLREIRLIGLKRTNQKVIRRVMKSKPGEAYSEIKIRRDLEELFATRWFDDIKPRPVDTGQPAVFDLEIEFVEGRTGQINGGIALDPQSRLVGFASYSDSNFLGLGQTSSINLSQATVGGGTSAELGWGNRFYDSKGTSVSARLYSRVVYNFTGSGFGSSSSPIEGERFDERRTGGSIAFARPFEKIYRAKVGFQFDNVKSINLDPTLTDGYVQQDGDIFAIQLGVDRDTRHPSGDPFQGELVSLLLEPSFSDINKIGGNVSTFDTILGPNYYLKSTIEFRKYWSAKVPADTPVTRARSVAAFRATYGHVSGDVPFFEQYFMGGLGSLRGYPNQRFWGKQSALLTFEYRYAIQRNFSLVPFVDYGSAWGGYPSINDFTQSDGPNFHFGYGIGLSFRTPVAPIRIDFAFNDQGGSRTHFAFGTSF